MCTVTYLPKNNNDFILTSSRDEAVLRPAALEPSDYFIHGKKIVFPKDPLAGGSWIAFSEGRVACLLNGGFVKHIPSPPYKKSRGLVLLDYFSYSSANEFSKGYNFKGIEPFTLVILENNSLVELRWDGHQTALLQLPSDRPAIWSSVTLYTEETISKRKIWFDIWLNNNNPEVESIRSFHRSAGDGDKKNDLLMNRDNVLKTVSITSIEKKGTDLKMIYESLLQEII